MSGSLRSLARRAFAAAAVRPTVAAAPKAPYANIALRAMATGPAASATKISDELLEKLGELQAGLGNALLLGEGDLMKEYKKLVEEIET